MAQDLQHSERILYQLLREWLSQRDPDLWADFERDPEGTASRLRDFLKRGVTTLPPTLATYVSGGRVEKLVNIAQAGVVYIQRAEAEPTLTPEERQELERHYLEQVRKECRYLETEGVDRARAELTDVFVMLEAVESPRREAEADVAPVPERAEEMGLKERAAAALFERREAEREERAPPPPPVPLSQALGAHTHLVILGEPGTGKTTTLQFVALCFATDGWAKQRLELDEARVPVRVALREYDGAERLDRFFIQWLDRAYVPEPLAQDWLTGGRLAILLDGLDEVPEARRAAVVEAIERFATTPEGQRCRIVVTSRIAGYRGVRGLGAEFGHYTIRPFTGPQDALPYAAGWVQALKPEGGADEAEALLEEMERQGGLRRVIGNPLLLRLAVAVYVETGELVRSRAELYRRYVEEVLAARERARGTEDARWSRQQVEMVLETIAWMFQTEGEKTVTVLAKAVEKKVGSLADGLALVNYLRERLGLLAVYGYEKGEVVAFRHLTFREFFVARRLALAWEVDREQAWHFLHPRLHHPDWREPVLLLAGMIGRTQATELVQRVLKARSPCEKELYRDLLLAATIIGDGAPLKQQVFCEVTSPLLSLFTDIEVRWWHKSANLAIVSTLIIGILLSTTTVLSELLTWLSKLSEPPIWFSKLSALLAKLVSSFGLFVLASVSLALIGVVVFSLSRSALDAILAFLGPHSGHGRYSLLQNRLDGALTALGMLRPQAIGEPLCEIPSRCDFTLWPRISVILQSIGWVKPEILTILVKALEVPELQEVRRIWAEEDGQLTVVLRTLFLENPTLTITAMGQWWRAGRGSRQKAAEALGPLARIQPEVVAKLTEALKDNYGGARWATGQALSKAGIITPTIAAILFESAKDRRRWWITEPRLLSEGRQRSGPVAVPASMFVQFGRSNPEDTLPILLDAALSNDPEAQSVAIWALSELSDIKTDANVDAVVTTLLRLLEDGIEPRPTIEALGEWGVGRQKVASVLLSIMRSRGRLRVKAAAALGKMGICSPEVVTALLETLKDTKEEWDLETVTSALGDLGAATPEVIAALVERALPLITWQVADVLIRLSRDNVDEAKYVLLKALREGDEYTQEVTAWILGELGESTPDVVAALVAMQKPWWVGLWGILRTLFTDFSVKEEQRELVFQERQVQLAVAEALGKLGVANSRTISALITVSKREYRYKRRRIAAVEALGRLEVTHRKVVEALLNLLLDTDHEMRLAAAEALGRLGVSNQKIITTLAPKLQGRDAEKRKAVAEMLGHLTYQLDRDLVEKVARSQRKLLIDTKQEVADAAYEALDGVVARLTELDVAALGAEPVLFAPFR